MPTKYWQPLQTGDVVQIIAPSSKPLNPEQGCEKIRKLLRSWKLEPLISNKIFGTAPGLPELANSDDKRFADLRDAILNPEVKAIWCLRGGYGTIRLLPYLQDYFHKAPQVKLFIGYSDITLLHHYFQQQWKWSTVHAAGALQVAENRVAKADSMILRRLIFGQTSATTIQDLVPLNATAHSQGTVRSTLMGGNLTLINRMLGTPYTFQVKNKILVLEDIDEPFRKIDGILQQLKLAGYWTAKQKPAAIILGDFSIKQPLQQQEVNTSLEQFAQELDIYRIPVLRCIAIGHGAHNHPLPLATKTTLTLGKKPLLIAQSGCRN
ncbi:MAG: LD-carboxypeptidase [Gammaproteobacteria bacterium]